MHDKDRQRFEALEKRVEIQEKKLQELIDNIRIFMVKDEDEKEVDCPTHDGTPIHEHHLTKLHTFATSYYDL